MVFGQQRFTLPPTADGHDLEAVFFGGVVVLDEHLGLLLRHLNLRLLPTCAGTQHEKQATGQPSVLSTNQLYFKKPQCLICD